jgi:predicted Abi (CAAX) family protease
MIIATLVERAVLSLSTLPSVNAAYKVVGVTLITTSTAGAVAAGTNFIDPWQDWDPPDATRHPVLSCLKPLSAFLVPSLLEEVFWRGSLLPPPSSYTAINSTATTTVPWFVWAVGVLAIHVLSHPVAARTVWPRGRHIFDDPRFLCLTTIVLGGATVSFWVSGGSAWAAAITHGVPVALWRDFFGGEAKLIMTSDGRDDDDDDSLPVSRPSTSSKQRKQ